MWSSELAAAEAAAATAAEQAGAALRAARDAADGGTAQLLEQLHAETARANELEERVAALQREARPGAATPPPPPCPPPAPSLARTSPRPRLDLGHTWPRSRQHPQVGKTQEELALQSRLGNEAAEQAPLARRPRCAHGSLTRSRARTAQAREANIALADVEEERARLQEELRVSKLVRAPTESS